MSELYHDPANVTNPEHADHHIVTPLSYCYCLRRAAGRYRHHGRRGVCRSGNLQSGRGAGHCLHQGCDCHSVLHACEVSVEAGEDDGGSGFFTFLVLITMTLTDYMSRAWGLW